MIRLVSPDCLLHAANAFHKITFDFVFPEPDYNPSFGTQSLVGDPVSRHVARRLVSPIGRVALRLAIALGATVPEAPVNKDGHSGSPERYIRAPGDRR